MSGLASVDAADAKFLRGINLNGPAVTIDGHAWEAGADAKDFKANGKTFENQKVVLKPADGRRARAQMIRSSVWGGKVSLEFTGRRRRARIRSSSTCGRTTTTSSSICS